MTYVLLLTVHGIDLSSTVDKHLMCTVLGLSITSILPMDFNFKKVPCLALVLQVIKYLNTTVYAGDRSKSRKNLMSKKTTHGLLSTHMC